MENKGQTKGEEEGGNEKCLCRHVTNCPLCCCCCLGWYLTDYTKKRRGKKESADNMFDMKWKCFCYFYSSSFLDFFPVFLFLSLSWLTRLDKKEESLLHSTCLSCFVCSGLSFQKVIDCLFAWKKGGRWIDRHKNISVICFCLDDPEIIEQNSAMGKQWKK